MSLRHSSPPATTPVTLQPILSAKFQFHLPTATPQLHLPSPTATRQSHSSSRDSKSRISRRISPLRSISRQRVWCVPLCSAPLAK